MLPRTIQLCLPFEIESAHLNGNRSECQERLEASGHCVRREADRSHDSAERAGESGQGNQVTEKRLAAIAGLN
jgi:hypothetical protein